MTIKRLASFKTGDDFIAYIKENNITLPFFRHVSANSSLARPYVLGNKTIGNRFAVLPMEGWDGTPQGLPSELVERRWRHFGASGAKLVWGERIAQAVRMPMPRTAARRRKVFRIIYGLLWRSRRTGIPRVEAPSPVS